jgi:hypothetical protein
VKAWFYGKLLLAVFCEMVVNKGRFGGDPESMIGIK